MSYKTLILIDNSSELTSLNQDTVRAIVRYFVKNAPDDNKVAIAVTGDTAEYLTEYDDTLNTQLKTIDNITYTDTNAPGVDVLMETILDWEQGDLAMRDIVYISGRNIGIGGDYSEEELLFEINGKQYPIYIIGCAQNENDGVLKGYNILSRISGGECVTTSDVKSDADIEKQICDKLFTAMKTRRMAEEEALKAASESRGKVTTGDSEYTEYTEETTSDDESVINGENTGDAETEVTGEYESERILSSPENNTGEMNELEYGAEINDPAPDENVIYEYSKEAEAGVNAATFIYPVIIVVLITCICAAVILTRRRRDKKDDDRFKKSVAGRKSGDDAEDFRMPFEDVNFNETVVLRKDEDEEDTGTRLLYRARDGIEITLEDRADPTRYFRACVCDSIVIGRSEKLCDIAIGYDDSVSGRHCELYSRDGVLYCRDLGSSNGTMVNKQKVYQEIAVESGDILRIGRLTFFIQIVGEVHE